jgi:Tfp pilus assembly protein PilO
VVVIAALFACDFVFCGYIPAHKRWQSLQQTRAQQQRTIQTAAAQGAELPSLQRRLQDVEATAQRYDTCVPAEGMLGVFLQQIAGIMTKCHLADQVVIPGNEWAADRVNGISIHMTGTGGLPDLFDFFTDLQALDRLVRIEKVVLKNDSAFLGRVSMEVETTIFHQAAPQGRAGASTDSRSADRTRNGA